MDSPACYLNFDSFSDTSRPPWFHFGGRVRDEELRFQFDHALNHTPIGPFFTAPILPHTDRVGVALVLMIIGVDSSEPRILLRSTHNGAELAIGAGTRCATVAPSVPSPGDGFP